MAKHNDVCIYLSKPRGATATEDQVPWTKLNCHQTTWTNPIINNKHHRPSIATPGTVEYRSSTCGHIRESNQTRSQNKSLEKGVI